MDFEKLVLSLDNIHLNNYQLQRYAIRLFKPNYIHDICLSFIETDVCFIST